VTGVVYRDADGKDQRQKARVLCVAGNSIETPRLLLLSASSKYPDGLANSSGQVGRNYMRHMTGSVYALFERPVEMYRGTTMAGIVQDRVARDPSGRLSRRPAAEAQRLSLVPLPPPPRGPRGRAGVGVRRAGSRKPRAGAVVPPQ
jgi:choline dehydrogenase-like flavoprotein